MEGGGLIKVALGTGGIVGYPEQDSLRALEVSKTHLLASCASGSGARQRWAGRLRRWWTQTVPIGTREIDIVHAEFVPQPYLRYSDYRPDPT